MRKLLYTIIAILCWATLAAAQSFTVVTANVQHGEGTDLAFNCTRQVTALNSMGADLIAVQERTTNETCWNGPMASAGYTEAVYRENHPDQGDGPAIWYRTSKFTLLDTQQVDLQTGTLIGWNGSTVVNKAAVAAKLSFNGRVFWFVSTHLCWSACADSQGSQFSAQRVGQINTLRSWMSSTLTGAPIVLAGDMNFGPDYPKSPSGLQKDLFTDAFDDLWNVGLAAGTATTPWGDRDADGIADMTPADLGTQTSGTRTHDTRRIDYIFLTKGQTLFTLTSISVPDGRAACSTALTTGGVFKQCPDVQTSQQSDVTDDQGVRVSDHNFIRAVLSITAVAPPTASLSCPATAFVGEPVVCDGSASTNVNGQVGWSTTPFSADGTAPVAMDFGDGQGPYSRSELLKATHAYLTPGTYTVNLTVRNSAGVSASAQDSITISAIPDATGGAIQTLTDQGSNSANCTALQNALNTAFAANTVPQEIRLPAITYTCQVSPPAAAGTSYVTVRPTNISWLPGPLTRITPALSTNMPKLNAPHGNGSPIVVAGVGRRYLRLLGIEFTKPQGLIMNSLLMIGTDGNAPPTAYNQLPDHIIFDRCYLHGNPTDDTTRGILLYGNDISILNSYFTDFHDGGADSQAVAVMDGKRMAYVNNYTEAYGENLLWGGSETRIRFSATASSGTPTSTTLSSVANLNVGDGISFMVAGNRGPWSASIVRSIVGSTITFDQITNAAGVPTAPDTTTNTVKYGSSPADIFIARNYLYKSLTFRVGDPSYGGVFTVVKNSFELKHAMRVVFVANVIENMWGNQGQDGHTVLFTPRNQTCFLPPPGVPDPVACPSQDNPWVMVRDVQLSHTRVRNIPDFLNILGTDNLNPPGEGNESGPSALAQNIVVRETLIDGEDPAGTGAGQMALIWPCTTNITISHNTQVNVAGGAWILSTEAPCGRLIPGALVVNNIAPHQTYGVFGDGRFIQDFIPYFMPDGFVRYNVLTDDGGNIGPNGEIWSAPRAGPNYFPPNIGHSSLFVDLASGNFRLRADSPYKAGNATPAADGTDMGVNFDDLVLATANVAGGNWLVVLSNSGNLKGRATLNGKAVIR